MTVEYVSIIGFSWVEKNYNIKAKCFLRESTTNLYTLAVRHIVSVKSVEQDQKKFIHLGGEKHRVNHFVQEHNTIIITLCVL